MFSLPWRWDRYWNEKKFSTRCERRRIFFVWWVGEERERGEGEKWGASEEKEGASKGDFSFLWRMFLVAEYREIEAAKIQHRFIAKISINHHNENEMKRLTDPFLASNQETPVCKKRPFPKMHFRDENFASLLWVPWLLFSSHRWKQYLFPTTAYRYCRHPPTYHVVWAHGTVQHRICKESKGWWEVPVQ